MNKKMKMKLSYEKWIVYAIDILDKYNNSITSKHLNILYTMHTLKYFVP